MNSSYKGEAGNIHYRGHFLRLFLFSEKLISYSSRKGIGRN